MYKISVPVSNGRIERNGREKTLVELKRLDAERIFLGCGNVENDPEKREKVYETLKENCKFFKDNGFEVGSWNWAFMIENNNEFTNMRSVKGQEIKLFMCPTDEKYVEFACENVRRIAACGVDIINFDDDFRYGILSDSPGCLCDNHIAMINEITGENSSREQLCEHILSGGKNKYRDAWLKANGDAFRNFAKRVREALDEVNPEIRMSFCSCITSWDVDGTNAFEIAKILAGNTKPLVRLIGAPYWAVNQSWGNSLQDTIEIERLESSWTRQGKIEIMAEGDCYPRPRTTCPASYVEGFDTAIRASGMTDGILKYGIDYISNADYETGYADFHEKNRPVYKEIDKMFGGKTHVGVRVYETMSKTADMVVPTKVNSRENMEHHLFSRAARTLAYNTIPTVYEGEGVCGIVFDENARKLPLKALKKGLIIDSQAAEILMERGIDVGIESFGVTLKGSREEKFLHNNNHIISSYNGGTDVNDLILKNGAEVLSETVVEGKTVPMSYRYENADGNRFLVLNMATRFGALNVLKHYERSRQYAENVCWLGGEKLPAYCYGNPALYIQCAKDKSSMAVGLWNFFADEILKPVIELDKKYSEVKLVNCDGYLEGNKLVLTSGIKAFGFCFAELK